MEPRLCLSFDLALILRLLPLTEMTRDQVPTGFFYNSNTFGTT
jgi:hypothetical protein